MPWTFVHPAAVLPLRQYCANRHLFGALVVGSVSPDLGYYVGRFDMATIAHTLLGLLIVCLPTGRRCSYLFGYCIDRWQTCYPNHIAKRSLPFRGCRNSATRSQLCMYLPQ
jgi:Domain of unknown function (DUF4184)